MDLSSAFTWASERTNAVLITIRADGRPQSSDIAYFIEDGVIKISVTADRAKTANIRRDPRVVVHITDPGTWSYLSFDGTATLLKPAADPTDATTDALVDYYAQVAGQPHPDWDEYRAAMVAEQRLLILIEPKSVVGQVS